MKTVIFALNSSYSHTSLAARAIARGMERHGICCEIIEKNQKEKRASVLATLAEAGADVYTVQHILGHSKLSTTEIYAEVQGGAKRKAVEALAGLLKNPQE